MNRRITDTEFYREYTQNTTLFSSPQISIMTFMCARAIYFNEPDMARFFHNEFLEYTQIHIGDHRQTIIDVFNTTIRNFILNVSTDIETEDLMESILADNSSSSNT